MIDESHDVCASIAAQTAAAEVARLRGDDVAAERSCRGALDLALRTLAGPDGIATPAIHLQLLQAAAELALNCGDVSRSRTLCAQARELCPDVVRLESWRRIQEPDLWPDEWLIAAIRCEPPDTDALDTLVERHWKPLFGRCRMLSLDQDKARDLAQQTWLRILRSRQGLRPGRNFPGYLATIATNLWRDSRRSAHRAGALAEHRLVSLDEPLPGDGESSISFADVLPDPKSVHGREHALLKLDLDRALEHLPPHFHDALISRFIAGESCASIGARYQRTEQAISGWIRQAMAEMKRLLEEPTTQAEDRAEA